MTERISSGPEIAEPIKNEPKSIKEYLHAFERSAEYRQALNQFVDERVKAGANRAKVTRNFSQVEAYRRALWDYYRAGNPLQYHEGAYGPDFISKINDYWAKTREMMQRERIYQVLDLNLIEHLEQERSAAHTAAAFELVKDQLVADEKTGRLLVHFLSIDQGLDTPTPSRDEMRRQAYRSR